MFSTQFPRRLQPQPARFTCEFMEPRQLLSVPAGDQFLVNTITAMDQTQPKVAMDAAGNCVIAWTCQFADGISTGNFLDVHAQRYNAAGLPVGGEFTVNRYTQGSQLVQDVAMNAHGEFVVLWDSSLDDARGGGFFAQRFTAAGLPHGAEILISAVDSRNQEWPNIAIDDAGAFVVAGRSGNVGGSFPDIVARRFDANGSPLSDVFKVNSGIVSGHQPLDLAMNAAGEFVVAWPRSRGGSMRLYHADGNAKGSELPFVDYTRDSLITPSLAMADDGHVAIAWELHQYRRSIWVRRFDPIGNPLDEPFSASSTSSGNQSWPTIALDAGGRFTVAWSGQLTQGGSEAAVTARQFDSNGTPTTDPFRVSSTSGLKPRFPHMALSANGDFVAAWDSVDPADGRIDVYARRFIAQPFVFASSFEFESAPMRLSFEFNKNVSASLAVDDIVIRNVTTGQTIPTAAMAVDYDVASNVATIHFPGYPGGILPDGDYATTLAAAGITDSSGQPMDSDAVLSFWHLGGDANRDRRVNVDDLAILASHWRESPSSFSHGDFNLDGTVDEQDAEILIARWQSQLSSLAAPTRARLTRPIRIAASASSLLQSPDSADRERDWWALLGELSVRPLV